MPLLGALGPSLDGLGRVSGCSWEVLGPLGRVLGGSWAALGGSWTLLGRSWRPSWDHPIIRSKTSRSTSISPNFLGRFWLPKWAPKRQIRGFLSCPLWTVLGSRAALGRFWAMLGGSWGDLWPLLGALGPSWDGLGGHLETNQSQDRNPERPP